MAAAETARLIASLELKDLFSKQIAGAEKSLGSFDKKLDGTTSRAYKAGTQIGTGIKAGAAIAVGGIAFLAANIATGLKSLTELETVTTQTNAVLKSTKGIAGETAESIRNLAEKYEGLNATIDDKVIQSAENVLLTFTAIRKDAFEPAIKAALDMSTALGTDLQGSVIQIGKALQDPIKGITALRRVGVNFSADQVKVIKALVDTGHAEEAQRLILKELNTEFGGSFLAGGTTTAGKVAKFKDSIEDLQKALATALLPTIGKVADGLSKFLADPNVVKGVSELGQSIAGLFSDKNLAAGADFLKGAFETAKATAPIVASAAKATFGFVQAAVGLFKQLPPGLQGLLVGGFAVNKLTGGLVTNIAGGIIDAVGKQFLQRGGTPANPLFVADVTGGLGGGGAAGGGGLLSKLGTIITKLAGIGLLLGGTALLSNGVQTGGPIGAAQAAGGAAAGIGGAALLLGPLGAIAASVGLSAKTLLDIRGQNAALGDGIATSVGNQIAGGASLADLKQSLGAVNQGINDIQANPLNVLVAGDALDNLRAQRDALERAVAVAERGYPLMTGTENNTGKMADDIAVIPGTLRALETTFSTDLKSLIAATKAADVRKTATKIGADVAKGAGNADNTSKVLSALKTQLLHTTDEKTRAVLKAQIARVEHVLPDRQYAAKQYAAVAKILADGKITASESKKLTAIQRSVKDHGLPAVQHGIQKRIDAAKAVEKAGHDAVKAAVAGVKAAVNRDTQAIKDKDLSVSVVVPITTQVSIRDLNNVSVRANSFGRIAVKV